VLGSVRTWLESRVRGSVKVGVYGGVRAVLEQC
jgi:hypothetical protein